MALTVAIVTQRKLLIILNTQFETPRNRKRNKRNTYVYTDFHNNHFHLNESTNIQIIVPRVAMVRIYSSFLCIF